MQIPNGSVSHSYLVLFGDNGVCVFSALTSVGALFYLRKLVLSYKSAINIGGQDK